MNTFNISLDVDKLTRAQPPVVIAQGDRNGTTIAAKVYDHGTLLTQSGLSARFKMRLPDGRYFYSKAATWTADTGTVSVTVDETQAASAVGTTTGAYFELLNGSTVVYSTSRFTVRVLRSATDMSAQADSYDDRVEEIIAAMDVAVEAVEDAQEAAASANAAAASATSAATNANTARDNANDAASAANSAASTATSAAGTANNAATNANGAAQTANAAATSANDAATAANTAAERAEAIAEYSVPEMSPTTRGGAKLGSGLSMDGDVLSVALESESDGTDAGPIVELTAKGWATQDGAPSPDSPVEIQVVRGRNLLRNTATSQTINGVTFTVNADGSVTANGTATANAGFNAVGDTTIGAGTYTFSGCPSGGGNSTYEIQRRYGGVTYRDYGSGATFTVTDGDTINTTVGIIIHSGVTCNNLVFKPQIELGSIAHPYVPYGYVGVEAQGKNLLPKLSTNVTNNGITFTANKDGSITANGTATAASPCIIVASAIIENNETYTLSGCPKNVSGIALRASDSITRAYDDTGSGATFSYADTRYFTCYITVANGVTVNNLTFYPQLELGSTATSYEPYYHSTTPIPLPSRGWVGALPDGTADTLTLDGAGKVVWERATDEVVLDGSTNKFVGKMAGEGANEGVVDRYSTPLAGLSVGNSAYLRFWCSRSLPNARALVSASWGIGDCILYNVGFYLCLASQSIEQANAWLSTHPVTVLYPLATPVTEDMGYVNLPEIPVSASLSIPELDALNVRYVVDDAAVTLARQWYERARSEYEGRLSTLESIVAGLV